VAGALLQGVIARGRLLRSGDKPTDQLTDVDPGWFAVRCVVHHAALGKYEERITLWQSATLDEAIAQAEHEVEDYACVLEDAAYVGLAQAYHLFDEPGHGAEIFSQMRDSPLLAADYLTRSFDTDAEHQQNFEDG
jgi:hypothetical protein